MAEVCEAQLQIVRLLVTTLHVTSSQTCDQKCGNKQRLSP